ncbi:BBLF2/BBLF3 linker [Vombatid gammaherpesvirus 1]|uniref:BBLF2/BBLF3 linker n=1 Tax=Vombatid gammaherpesvirus 1 TaxID=2052651 RepID=A0A3S5HA05_9GAMA|nr:BBLF2/BBLF3 linker [Vombatid gammaherpesvirus 1]AZB49138.1 BBLF2/BBLF3 linker [Vombatid gammaherpesvirus 1]
MDVNSEKVVTILGVYFYTWIKVENDSLYAIYQVIYYELNVRGICFYLVEIPQNLQPPPLPSSDDTTVWIYNRPILVWELRLRLHNQLLHDLLSEYYPAYRVHILDGLLVHATRYTEQLDFTPLSGYLHCETRMQFIDPLPTPSNNWHIKLAPTVNISELNIYLKTRDGVFIHTTCQDEPPGNRPKYDTLTIDDIFHSHDITIRPHPPGKTYHLRAILPSIDILWMNRTSNFNGGPVIFFNSLFKKLYADFTGVTPLRSYIFPMGVHEGSPFNSHFPGFPFIHMDYGSPSKRPSRSPMLSYSILLPYLTDSPDVRVLEEKLLSGPWQPKHHSPCLKNRSFIDYNTEHLLLCDTSDKEARTIHIQSPHSLIHINLGQALLYPSNMAFLDYLLKVCSPETTAIFWNRYNCLLEAITGSLHHYGYHTLLIHRTTLVFYRPTGPEVADADHKTLDLLLSEVPELIFTISNRQETRMTLYHSELVIAHVLDTPAEDTSWMSTLRLGAATMEANSQYTAQDAIRSILPILTRNRGDTKFWVIPTSSHPTDYPAPIIPIDCQNFNNTYIWTHEGTVFWHRSWSAPINIDYEKYLIEILLTLKRLENTYSGTCKISDAEKRNLQSMVKVLNLL